MSIIAQSQNQSIDRDDIIRTFRLMVSDGGITEVRLFDAYARHDRYPQIWSGYFNDPDRLCDCLEELAGWKAACLLLNEPDPALFARAANRLRAPKKDPTTSDGDIIRRRHLLIDADPKRLSGISSTNAEHDEAIRTAESIDEDLYLSGWHAGILGDSANGGHLIKRIDLSTSEEDTLLLQKCLEAIHAKFSTKEKKGVEIDTSVFNLSRISKLYGTIARKGDSTEDRPHRLSRIISAPDKMEVVPRELLEELAARAPSNEPAKPKKVNGHSFTSANKFDLDDWTCRHSLDLGPETSWTHRGGTGRRWNFNQCPFSTDHKEGAYLLEFSSGAVAAGCLHNRCRSKGWEDLRDQYEPGWRDKRSYEPRRASAEEQAAVEVWRQSGVDIVTPAPSHPDPIPLDNPRPPELPSGIFKYAMGEMIDAVAEATESPRELPAAFAVTSIATVIQRRFSALIKPGYFESTNIWIVCALPPGNRKTENMRRMIAPLVEWEDQQAGIIMPQIEQATSERKTIEGRIARLRADAAKAKAEDFSRISKEIADAEASLPEIPRVPQLFTQDVTPEHTGTMLSDNGERLALLSDEGGLFDVMGGRYSDGLPNLDVFLQSHAGAPVRVNRGNRPAVNLKHPALTIGVSPQPDVLRGLGDKRAMRKRGLLARFLYMLPVSPLGWRTNNTDPVPDRVVDAWRRCVLALADVRPDEKDGREVPHVLALNTDARELWSAFWAETETMMRPGGKLENVTDWAGKLPGAVARLAAILHCADYHGGILGVKSIEAGTMARAIQFGQFLTEHAMLAFDVMGADPAMETARDLWRIIERARKPVISLRDAWHPLRGKYKTVPDAEPGFDVLIDHGYLLEPHQGDSEAPRKRGRQPSRQFLVNPKLTEGWT